MKTNVLEFASCYGFITDPTTNINVIFHKVDADGWCSAASIAIWVYWYTGKHVNFIPYNYGMKLPKFVENDVLIFGDISADYESKEFDEIYNTVKMIYVFDHHVSSMKKLLNKFDKNSEGMTYLAYRQMNDDGTDRILAFHNEGIAGCEVVYRAIGGWPELPCPEFIQKISIYDAWQKQNPMFDECVKYMNGLMFKMYMPTNDTFDYSITNLWFQLMLDNKELNDEIQQLGSFITKYKNKQNKELCEKCTFKATLTTKTHGDISIVLVSGCIPSSKVFDAMDVTEFDAMSVFNLAKSGWTFSLYTTKDNIDCSKIAEEFNGGGHKQAAGFRIPLEQNPLSIFKEYKALHEGDYKWLK